MNRTPTKEAKTLARALLVDRPYDPQPVRVPDVINCDDDTLLWSFMARQDEDKRKEPDPDLLRVFLRLASPSVKASEFFKFAQSWGPLYLCRHGEPGGHVHWQEDRGWVLKRCGSLSLEGRESIHGWRGIARRLEAILAIAAELHQGRPAAHQTWEVLIPKPREDEAKGFQSRLWQRQRIEREIRSLAVLGGVGLGFSWDSDGPSLQLGGNGLFGALVAQLQQAVCDGERFFVCQACKMNRLRPAQARPSKYCEDCGLKGNWKVNKREQRRIAGLILDLHARSRSTYEMALRLAEERGRSRSQFIEEKARWIERVERIIARGIR